MKPSLFPSKDFRWPDHSPYCPGRPGYKGVCDCGAEAPSDVAKLRAERDELLAALEEARARCSCVELGQDHCLSCENDIALIARIKGGG